MTHPYTESDILHWKYCEAELTALREQQECLLEQLHTTQESYRDLSAEAKELAEAADYVVSTNSNIPHVFGMPALGRALARPLIAKLLKPCKTCGDTGATFKDEVLTKDSKVIDCPDCTKEDAND